MKLGGDGIDWVIIGCIISGVLLIFYLVIAVPEATPDCLRYAHCP